MRHKINLHMTKNVCAQKMCAQNLCRKCAHTKCAENVHTQNVQKMCTHKMCRIVHTQKNDENVHTEFCAEVVRRVCVRVVRRVVSENCVDEKFPVMHIRKFYAREHCPTCVQKVLCRVLCRFVQIVHVRKCAQTVTCAKCQKWPKNDQK